MALTISNEEYTEFRNLWEQMKGVFDEASTERIKYGTETSEVKQKLDLMETRIQQLDAKASAPPQYGGGVGPQETKEQEKETRMAAFRKAIKFGYQTLTKEEKQWLPQASAMDAPALPFTPGFQTKAGATLTVSEDTTGGFFAPPEFDTTIIKGLILYSPMRQYARTRTTSARSVQMGKRTGVISAAWTSEKKSRDPIDGFALGRVEIPVQEMYSLVKITEQDLEDPVIDIEAEIRLEMSEQFGVAENRAYLLGDGLTQPQGLMTNTDIPRIKSGVDGSPTVSGITSDTLMDLCYDLPDAWAQDASWMMRRTTLGAVRKLKYPSGTNQDYIWQPGLQQGLPATILDRPYVEFPDMPKCGTAGIEPIIFGNIGRGYVVVQRVGMAYKRLAERWAEDAVVGIYARMRVGGQVIQPDAFRIYKTAV